MVNRIRFYVMKDVDTGKYVYVNYNLYLDTYDYKLVDNITDLNLNTKSTSDLKSVIDKFITRAEQHTGMKLKRVLVERKITIEDIEIREK